MTVGESSGSFAPVRVTVRRATHADQHSANFTGWLNEFTQLTPGAFEGVAREVWIGPLQLFHDSVNRATRYRGCAWKQSRVLLSFLPAYGRFHLGEKSIPTGTILSYRWDEADRFNLTSGFESVGVCVDEGVLQEHASSVWEVRRYQRRRILDPAMTCQAACRHFQEDMLTLINQLCGCPAILDNAIATKLIVDDLLETIASVTHETVERTDRPSPAVRAYIVNKAQEFIEKHLATGVSLSELCKTLRVSRRALEYAFRDVVGIPPKRYMMALRLGRARRDIIAGGTLPCISEVAERWGFYHLGRFSGIYREFFGELPSTTARTTCR